MVLGSEMTAILRSLIVSAILACSAGQAASADISIMPSLGPGSATVVFVKGEFRKGDGADFELKAGTLRKALILLSSPGGSIAEALRIGAVIRTQGLATMVVDECASACALIWLSGIRR